MAAKPALPAIDAAKVEPSAGSNYPAEFKPVVSGRVKRKLGDAFGLTNFGVNLTTLKPGAASALRHWHVKQDEFIYVVSGELVLVTDAGEQRLTPGMCAGFTGGTANAHHLVNRSESDAAYLEIGDRVAGDGVTYPDDDLAATWVDGGWQFTTRTARRTSC